MRPTILHRWMLKEKHFASSGYWGYAGFRMHIQPLLGCSLRGRVE